MRHEVQDFLRSCERLLAAALVPDHPPFSPDELDMVEFYAVEISKMHAVLSKK
jgi:hypothetical protein